MTRRATPPPRARAPADAPHARVPRMGRAHSDRARDASEPARPTRDNVTQGESETQMIEEEERRPRSARARIIECVCVRAGGVAVAEEDGGTDR